MIKLCLIKCTCGGLANRISISLIIVMSLHFPVYTFQCKNVSLNEQKKKLLRSIVKMIMAILFILFALLSHFVSCKRLFEVDLANHLQWVDLKIEAVR